ncbi:MAG: VRR-NUC domain-containing protein [Peptococcaceae bacterium]|nr:VRR-NUC domain-containing protein [Eubacteriales bacterium]MDH7526467.1 VRR-NUC domain-containing protein [Peptococcaceae bacterium]
MSEKAAVKAIMVYLQGLEGCFAWKEHGGMYGTTGLPDIICCYKGRFIGLEVKKPGGKLTKLQEITLRDIERAGGVAAKVSSLKEVIELLNALRGGGL